MKTLTFLLSKTWSPTEVAKTFLETTSEDNACPDLTESGSR